MNCYFKYVFVLKELLRVKDDLEVLWERAGELSEVSLIAF